MTRLLNKRTFFLSVPLSTPSIDTLTSFLFISFLYQLQLYNLYAKVGRNLPLTEAQGHVRQRSNKYIVVLPGTNYCHEFGLH